MTDDDVSLPFQRYGMVKTGMGISPRGEGGDLLDNINPYSHSRMKNIPLLSSSETTWIRPIISAGNS